MARKRRARRPLARVLLVWFGGTLLRRVQRRSLHSLVASAARPRRLRARMLGGVGTVGRRAATHLPSRRNVGRGVGVALLSGVAVTALRFGVGRVVEAERATPLVTPDFDVFADDDEQ